jgi:mannose-6-phosphate isomerase-like protein (cupin superfamily)
MTIHRNLTFNDCAICPTKERPTRLRLGIGNVHTLRRAAQRIHVVAGSAWISLDGDDIVLQRGQSVVLPAGQHAPVISATGHEPLVYILD